MDNSFNITDHILYIWFKKEVFDKGFWHNLITMTPKTKNFLIFFFFYLCTDWLQQGSFSRLKQRWSSKKLIKDLQHTIYYKQMDNLQNISASLLLSEAKVKLSGLLWIIQYNTWWYLVWSQENLHYMSFISLILQFDSSSDTHHLPALDYVSCSAYLEKK